MFQRTGRRDLIVMVTALPSKSDPSQLMAYLVASLAAMKPGAPEPVAEAPGAAPLISMTQLTGQQLRSNVYQPDALSAVAQRTPARGGARHDLPPAIAESTHGSPGAFQLPLVRSSSPAPGSHEFIGVRTAGGVVQTLFEKGKPNPTKKSWSMRPLYTDQKTAIVSLFVGKGPYIENYKLWQQYAMDIPPGPNRRILVTIRSGFDPKVEVPTASLFIGNSSEQTRLTVKKHDDWKTEGVRDEPQELRPAKNGRLPATPGTGTQARADFPA
jgi:hypothetical protein